MRNVINEGNGFIKKFYSNNTNFYGFFDTSWNFLILVLM